MTRPPAGGHRRSTPQPPDDTADPARDLDPAGLSARPGAKWHRVPPGVLAAWIADMDYPPAPAVVEAITARLNTQDLGYPDWGDPARGTPDPLPAAFTARMAARYGLQLDPGHVAVFCDVIQVVQAVLLVATRPGEPVVVQTPCYPPFLSTLATLGRPRVDWPWQLAGTGWVADPTDLARAVRASGARTLILVNPHNPLGRVGTRAELAAIADIVLREDLLVIADEVHAELTYPGHVHVPFASLAPELAARTVTVSSASKAFNLAGMRCALAHLGPRRVRAGLANLPDHLLGAVNVLGAAATLGAWSPAGDAWLAGVRARLTANRDLLTQALGAAAPEIGYRPPEASYLAWLDLHQVRDRLPAGVEPAAWLRERARVALSPGVDFGPGGAAHVRLNFATTPAVLTEIVGRLAGALGGRVRESK